MMLMLIKVVVTSYVILCPTMFKYVYRDDSMLKT